MMAIFTAIGTAIAGALFAGSAIAAQIITGVLAFGTSLAISYLTRPKARDYGATPSTAVQGQREYGARVPASALYGTGKVLGHHVFYAKWGKGNKFNADVFVLSNGWCDGLEEEIYFYGEKFDLIEDDLIGNEVKHYRVDGFDDLISIRFYDGGPEQGPDTKLVTDTAALGQTWKSTSVGSGICYVVVEREWNAAKFDKGEPQFEFILRGMRLYDPRLDDTVSGGEGDHRLDDPSTWEFSRNPAVQRFNYQIGIRGLISGRTIIGEGKSVGQLDLGSYIAAMNVCDTIREGKPTYQSALYVTSDDDHTEILKEFDDAMAGYGMNRRGLSGIIAGAPQVPVLEITSDDIDIDRPKQVKRRKSAFELYNHLSGQFTSPEAHWNPESLDPVFVNQDVSDDGRERQTANDFLQVTDPDIAQYLLQIRYRQNRKGGSATLPVSRRVGLLVQEGEWVEYAGLEWLITGWRCDEQFRFTLELAETGADVYASAGIVPGPIIVPPTAPVNPSLLSTVEGFSVAVGQIEGEDDTQVPALRFTWTPPEDPTITEVRFEYFVGDTPPGPETLRDTTDAPESGEYVTSKGVVPGVHYTARATIRTVPDRFKTFTPYVTTALPTPVVRLDVELSGAIQALLQQLDVNQQAALAPVIAALREEVEQLAQNTAGLVAIQDQFIQGSLVNYIGDANANITEVRTIADGLADLFVNVFAGNAVQTANARFRMSASINPNGSLSAVEMQVRATASDSFAQAGLKLIAAASEAGGQGIVALSGDQAFFENTATGERLPLHLVAIQDAPVTLEIDGGSVTPDLSSRRRKFRVLVNQNINVEWPVGVKDSDDWEIMLQFDFPDSPPERPTVTHDEERYLPAHPDLSEVLHGDINVLRYSAARTFGGDLVATVGLASAGQTVPPEANMLTFLQDVGATANLEGVWDPATELSFDTAISTDLRDLLGSGRDFDTRSVAFIGTEGGLSDDEHFLFDNGGDDYLLMQDQDWAQTFHENNAKASIVSMVYVPSNANSSGWSTIPIFSAFGLVSGDVGFPAGTIFEVSHLGPFTLDNYPPGMALGFTGDMDVLAVGIYNGASFSTPVAYFNMAFPSNRLDKWNMVAWTIDESIGANGATLRINNTVQKFTSTYTSPGSGSGISDYAIGLRYTRNDGSAINPRANANSRIGPVAAWSRRLSDAELDEIYSKLKTIRGYDLP